jgi:hypothetical protein
MNVRISIHYLKVPGPIPFKGHQSAVELKRPEELKSNSIEQNGKTAETTAVSTMSVAKMQKDALWHKIEASFQRMLINHQPTGPKLPPVTVISTLDTLA